MRIKGDVTVRQINPERPQDGGVSSDLFTRLKEAWPDRYRETHRCFEFPIESENGLQEIIRRLRDFGIKSADRSTSPPPFMVMVSRQYDLGEVLSAPLLRAFRTSDVGTMAYDDEGEPVIRSAAANSRIRFGRLGMSSLLVCRGAVKAGLEKAGLRHLWLKPLKFQKGVKIPKNYDPLFLLWSDIVLPPMTNWMFDNRGRVWRSADSNGPHSDGCFILDGYYTTVCWHYRKKDLDPLGEFDFAISNERVGNEPATRFPIVSQRFRQVCEDLKIRCEWEPVCVDEQPWPGGVDGPPHPSWKKA